MLVCICFVNSNWRFVKLMPREVDAQRYFPWLLLLFLGSGCAALIYEIVWLQMLELVIGASGISLGVLLGAFMGGMCLGSSLLPRLLPSHYHSLRIFALLELGIGTIGILAVFGIPYRTLCKPSSTWNFRPGFHCVPMSDTAGDVDGCNASACLAVCGSNT